MLRRHTELSKSCHINPDASTVQPKSEPALTHTLTQIYAQNIQLFGAKSAYKTRALCLNVAENPEIKKTQKHLPIDT